MECAVVEFRAVFHVSIFEILTITSLAITIQYSTNLSPGKRIIKPICIWQQTLPRQRKHAPGKERYGHEHPNELGLHGSREFLHKWATYERKIIIIIHKIIIIIYYTLHLTLARCRGPSIVPYLDKYLDNLEAQRHAQIWIISSDKIYIFHNDNSTYLWYIYGPRGVHRLHV